MWKRSHSYSIVLLLAAASLSVSAARDEGIDSAGPASSMVARVLHAAVPFRYSAARFICTTRHIGVLGRDEIHRRCLVGEPREEDSVWALFSLMHPGVRTGDVKYAPVSQRGGYAVLRGSAKHANLDEADDTGSSGSPLGGAMTTFEVIALLIGPLLAFFGYRVFQVRAACHWGRCPV